MLATNANIPSLLPLEWIVDEDRIKLDIDHVRDKLKYSIKSINKVNEELWSNKEVRMHISSDPAKLKQLKELSFEGRALCNVLSRSPVDKMFEDLLNLLEDELDMLKENLYDIQHFDMRNGTNDEELAAFPR